MLKEDLLGPILHQQLITGICKIRNTVMIREGQHPNLHIGDRNVLQGNILRKSAAEIRFPVVMTEH